MDRNAPLSVSFWGCGRWNTARTSFRAIRTRDPLPSKISAPQGDKQRFDIRPNDIGSGGLGENCLQSSPMFLSHLILSNPPWSTYSITE